MRVAHRKLTSFNFILFLLANRGNRCCLNKKLKKGLREREVGKMPNASTTGMTTERNQFF